MSRNQDLTSLLNIASKNKKGTTILQFPYKKMGGDLLFHKQVQYHQRGRA